MASKTGSCSLTKEDRVKLLKNLQAKSAVSGTNHNNEDDDDDNHDDDALPEPLQRELADAVVAPTAESSSTTIEQEDTADNNSYGTGCLCCGEDDDHANILLCEGCNAEYHTYCLDPPLRSVPIGDWYCSRCKSELIVPVFDDDGLERLVSALSPNFTSRFGEICWAQGGVGFGWWPAFIYDPRYTVGSARNLARKNLGKRHLVYFFECHDAPFAVLTSSKITKWEDGLMDDFHLGKAARAAGKARTLSFQQALQAATIELAKPVEMRMDWNHTEQPQILPSPQKKKLRKRKEPRKQVSAENSNDQNQKEKKRSKLGKAPEGFALLSEVSTDESHFPSKRNLLHALDAVEASTTRRRNAIVESAEDRELFVKLLKKPHFPPSDESSTEKENPSKNVGFIKLQSRKANTFADARSVIQKELVPDAIAPTFEWRFFVPGLGPVSSKQENKLGPIFSFLRQTTLDVNLGDGTLLNPLKVFIVQHQPTTNEKEDEKYNNSIKEVQPTASDKVHIQQQGGQSVNHTKSVNEEKQSNSDVQSRQRSEMTEREQEEI